jgi:hypothetical protein
MTSLDRAYFAYPIATVDDVNTIMVAVVAVETWGTNPI